MSLKNSKIMFMFCVGMAYPHPKGIPGDYPKLTFLYPNEQFGIFQILCLRLPLGVGVGHAHTEHKHDFWAFQTHSFSENKKLYKSMKYEKSYSCLKLMEKNKNSLFFGPNEQMDVPGRTASWIPVTYLVGVTHTWRLYVFGVT